MAWGTAYKRALPSAAFTVGNVALAGFEYVPSIPKHNHQFSGRARIQKFAPQLIHLHLFPELPEFNYPLYLLLRG